MAWYRTGTVALTNGSTLVTGTGTAFIANAQIGEGFNGPDGRQYEIVSIGSDTSLTIAPAYLGSTASGQSYAIAPLRGRIADLIAETGSLLSSFAAVRDGIGAGLFPDGTMALPGFRFAADQDTGIRRNGTNIMSLVTNGTDRMTLDASGRIGIGTGSPSFALDVQNAAPITVRSFCTDATSGSYSAFSASTATGINSVVYSFSGAGWYGTLTEHPLILLANNVARVVVETGGTVRPGGDGGQNLGAASFRWGTVFASTGTINTSDAREKHWRGAPEDAAIRAANRIMGELGFFQWEDSVAEKGEDGARIHFGVRAQQVIRIMIEEGLEDDQKLDFAPGKFIAPKACPSFRHAFLCFDTWEDAFEEEIAEGEVPVAEPTGVLGENGEPLLRTVTRLERRPTGKMIQTRKAGNRFGLRMDQLTMFLLAALARRVAALESKEIA